MQYLQPLLCFALWYSFSVFTVTITVADVPHFLLQITFLEFFEVLVGSAGVKCQLVSESLEECQMLSSPKAEARTDLPEGENRETKSSPFQSVRSFLKPLKTSVDLTHSMQRE